MGKALCRNCVYGNPPRGGDINKPGYCKKMLLDFAYNAPGCYWFEDKNKEGVNSEIKKD